VWSRDLGRFHTRLGWGEAMTPVIHGDSLLLNGDQEVDSALYCLDAKTGATSGRRRVMKRRRGTPRWS